MQRTVLALDPVLAAALARFAFANACSARFFLGRQPGQSVRQPVAQRWHHAAHARDGRVTVAVALAFAVAVAVVSLKQAHRRFKVNSWKSRHINELLACEFKRHLACEPTLSCRLSL